ncbi:hypothetical protein ALP52_00825 [Pseudomonas amygdali pv. mori]|uniref:Uncharacterized protein n=1 Tax=Pseudomonas amygdali pv. mori TaxID=34065 RepID=A0A3M5IMY9_PSEA0|nr:hypothetical protein [Pseudomonas amygdali]RMT12455.1 hypothetical protein ALP52_00825 [Pseudomonas amygdali pv. mori]
MVNAKAEAATTPSQAQVDFDKILNDKTYTDSAKDLGKTILKRLTSIGADTKIEELNGKIAKAAGENDVPLMKSLFAELNKLEQDQKNLKDQHKTIRGSNKFETVVQAWGSEIRELALSIAVDTIKSASAAQHQVNAGGDKGGRTSTTSTRATKDPELFVITAPDGRTANLTLQAGPVKQYKDKEAYELLGFTFGDDKKNVTAKTFKYADGTDSVNTGRKAIVEALLTKKPEKKAFEGFTIAKV